MTSKPVSANTFKQFVSTRMTLSLCRTFQTFVLLNMQSGRVNLPIDNGKQERHLHVFLTRPSLRTGSQVEFGVMNSARRASRAQGLRAKKNGGEGGGGGGGLPFFLSRFQTELFALHPTCTEACKGHARCELVVDEKKFLG